MKKIILLLVGLLVMTSASAAEYQYSPLVKEGKRWVYLDNLFGHAYFYVGLLTNTTEKNGHEYINYYSHFGYMPDEIDTLLDQEGVLKAFFREEDKRVYCIYNYCEEFEGEIYYMIYDYAKYFDKTTGENVMYDFNNITDPYIDPYNDNQPYFQDMDVDVYQEQVGDNLSNFYKIGSNVVIAERCGAVKDYRYNEMMLYPFNRLGLNAVLGNGYYKLAYIEDDGEIIYKGENYVAAQNIIGSSAIAAVEGDRQVSHVRYYNLAGVESNDPFKGVNIKVITYTDGSRAAEKVLK